MMKLFYSILFISSWTISIGQQELQLSEYLDAVDTFFQQNVKDGFVDYASISTDDSQLKKLVMTIEAIPLSKLNAAEKQAFLINSYNILVIDQVIDNYPVSSVKEIPGFFNRKSYAVGGAKMTLDQIEKDILLKEYKDSRFHFVLICGAKDCPEIWDRAYRPDNLDQQLEERTTAVLNDARFVKVSEKGVGLSEIFRWNRFEFGGSNKTIEYINRYRAEKIGTDLNPYYYEYDWTLNDVKYSFDSSYEVSNNSFRYVTSAAIPKGGIEVKLFNNLYSQIEGGGDPSDARSTYFTSSLSFLYGTSNRFNIGFATRYRRVLNNTIPSSPFDIFGGLNEGFGRQGITAFGPQIRWAPFKRLSNFSIQSSLTFPIGNELSGGGSGPFLDWAGPVFWTQFFNDKSIGDKFSLFTEIDLLIEEIGGAGKANRVSTPMTVIFSWFPKKNFTIYGLAGYSPFLVKPYDYFTQFGVGMKYQLSRNFEIEILATDFSNKYLNSVEGSAATYNFGFRYSR